MTTEKIFSITGKEVSKIKAYCKSNGENAETSDVSNINYLNGLHVFTILFGCGLSMSILTLIPRHDSIQEPEYWYEIIFPAGFWIFFVTTVMILDWLMLIERDSMVPIWLYLKAFSITFIGWLLLFFTCNMLWTKILEYNPPMPYIGVLCGIPSIIVGIVVVPMFAPVHFFEKQESRRKSINFIKYQLLWIVVGQVKGLLSKTFKELRYTDAQCVIAILVPIVKRCTGLVFSKAMKQMFGAKNVRANVLLMVTINFHYGFWVATTLAGARITTMVCTVAVEFLIQMSMSYEIVKLHKKVMTFKNDQAKMDKEKAILKLLLAELSEGLVPLAYAIGFSMAYYGPNGELIGNVRNGYLQHHTVCDASWTLLVMFGLFFVDLICLSLNSSILWVCCRVNLFDEFCMTMQKFWYIMALKMINEFYFQFFIKDVNFAARYAASNKNLSMCSNETAI